MATGKGLTTFNAIKSLADLPAFLRDGQDQTEFTEGVADSFGVLSLRGKVWRLKHKGEEHKVTKGGDKVEKLNVVILRGNRHISKIYYEKRYNEGDDSPPDCWATDGITPDANVPEPVSPHCAGCPMNAWGSRQTDDGRNVKACQDNRRLAVLVVDDSLDITVKEPVLLRLARKSLEELKVYADGLGKAGIPMYKIITQLTFDDDMAYPKVMFKPLAFDESQVGHWTELRNSEEVVRILNVSEHVAPEAMKPEPSKAETPAPQPAKAAAEKPKATRGRPPAAAKPRAAVEPPPEQEADDVGVPPAADVAGADLDDVVNRMLRGA